MARNEAKVTFLADTSNFRNELKQASQSITQINAEIKLATATFNNGGNAIDTYSKKQQLLTQKLNDLKTKEQAIIGQLESAKNIFGENSTEVQKLTTQLTNNRTQQQNVESAITAANQALQQEQNALQQNRSALGQLNNAISEQEKELNALKRAYVNAVLEQGESSLEAQDLRISIENLNRELNDNRNELRQAERSLQEFDEELDDSAESGESASKGWSVMGEVLADKVSDSIDSVIDGLKDLATESNDALTKLQAKTGESSKGMEKFKSVMDEIYKSGASDSFEDIGNAISEVTQQLGNMIDESDLKQVTTNALNLSNVYDMDVKESVRAVKSMMHQFGITSDEAYNLIVQGAQNGLNQNDDLLDTINEYSVQFASAGYSADDMFNILKNGVDAGTWSVDKLGDAVKEMNIRFSDGTVVDALNENRKILGFTENDVRSLQEEYNKGGTSAQSAVNKMVDAIMNVDDKTEQYKLGVSVFGTMWEDLGGKTVKSLSDTKGEIDKNKQSMDEVNNTVSGSLSQSFSSLGNSLKQDLLQPIADMLVPKITEIVNWCNENLPLIEPIIVGIVVAVTTLVAILGFKAILDGLTTAWIALNLAMEANPIVFIASLIVGLIAAIVYLWNTNENFRNAVVTIFTAIKDFLVTVFNAIKTVVTTVWNAIKSTITSVINAISSAISSVFNAIKNTITSVVNGIKSTVSSVWNAIKSTITSVINAISSAISSVFNAIKNTITSVFNGIKSTVSSVWNAIKSTITSVVNGIKSTITSVFNGMKSTITSVVNGIKSTVSTVFNAIKTAMTTPVQTAKTSISNILSSIKSAFSKLTLKLPSIKLPHLSISGSFGINPPKVPSFSVKWYKDGGIFTKPTILNSSNGLKGVGEAGAEAILPIDRLEEYIYNATVKAINLDGLANAINNLANRDINLSIDGKNIATATATHTDDIQGYRSILKMRGVSL